MDYQDYDQELHAQSFISQEQNFKQVDNALAYQKDVEYMKQLFPNALQVIQSAIDEECDKLEYSGSVMFDEYPDKTHLRMIVDNIMIRLTTSDNDEAEGEVQGTSLDTAPTHRVRYCPDDAMLDCEDALDNYTVEATELNESDTVQSQCYGPGAWGPPPPPPPIYWGGNRPCTGLLCPLANRRCGNGKLCPPIPYADFDGSGNPYWMRHLVGNMLINEMLYRRSRYRNHHF